MKVRAALVRAPGLLLPADETKTMRLSSATTAPTLPKDPDPDDRPIRSRPPSREDRIIARPDAPGRDRIVTPRGFPLYL